MSSDRATSPGMESEPPPAHQRLFLREPGWRIGLKTGSSREFCFTVAPGQDFYHRLLDGEIYVYHGTERLCLACAERRGLLSHNPRALRESRVPGSAIEQFLTDRSDYEVGIIDTPDPLP